MVGIERPKETYQPRSLPPRETFRDGEFSMNAKFLTGASPVANADYLPRTTHHASLTTFLLPFTLHALAPGVANGDGKLLGKPRAVEHG